VFIPVGVYEQELVDAIASLSRYVGPCPVGEEGVAEGAVKFSFSSYYIIS
jgi:hypothetical protein